MINYYFQIQKNYVCYEGSQQMCDFHFATKSQNIKYIGFNDLKIDTKYNIFQNAIRNNFHITLSICWMLLEVMCKFNFEISL